MWLLAGGKGNAFTPALQGLYTIFSDGVFMQIMYGSLAF